MHKLRLYKSRVIQFTTMYRRLARAFIRGDMPNYLIAFVTGRCNMSCSFCCEAAQKMRQKEELSPDQWADALKGARALMHLTVTGGEPFMRDDLDKLVIAIAETSGVPDISINTNGYYTEKILRVVEKMLTALSNINLTIAISLDGPSGIHDRLRNKKGASEAACKTIAGLNLLKGDFPNLRIRIQSLVLQENADILEKFLDETAGWPIEFHEIIFPRDVNNGSKPIQSLVDNYRKLAEKQLTKDRKTNTTYLKGNIFRVLYKNVLRELDGDYYNNPCLAGGRLVEVFPDGTVVGCEMAKVKDKAVIGFIGDSKKKLVDICRSGKADRFRREIALKCSCTFECAQVCNIVFNVKNWRELLKIKDAK